MFEDLLYITVYWLSGFAENNYEIWDSKKSVSFPVRSP